MCFFLIGIGGDTMVVAFNFHPVELNATVVELNAVFAELNAVFAELNVKRQTITPHGRLRAGLPPRRR